MVAQERGLNWRGALIKDRALHLNLVQYFDEKQLQLKNSGVLSVIVHYDVQMRKQTLSFICIITIFYMNILNVTLDVGVLKY